MSLPEASNTGVQPLGGLGNQCRCGDLRRKPIETPLSQTRKPPVQGRMGRTVFPHSFNHLAKSGTGRIRMCVEPTALLDGRQGIGFLGKDLFGEDTIAMTADLATNQGYRYAFETKTGRVTRPDNAPTDPTTGKEQPTPSLTLGKRTGGLRGE